MYRFDIEKIVINSSTPITMMVESIKFTCSPIFGPNSETRNEVIWSYNNTNSHSRVAEKLFDLLIQERCQHNHTELNSYGGQYLTGGEVWDNIEEELICLDCGKVLPVGSDPIPEDEIPF